MYSIVSLVALSVILFFLLDKLLKRSLGGHLREYEHAHAKYEKELRENAQLKGDYQVLEKSAEETIALYDITKDICKPLDEDQVFATFKDEMNKYLQIEDCMFLRGEIDMSKYNNYITLPLRVDRHTIGYLLASGVKKQDEDKFHILAQQFMLGVKRAHLYRRVQELAISDSLTQVSSRRYCMERLSEEMERSKKFNYVFSFLMLDVDHFKEFNDRYGHLVGDAILKEIAHSIMGNIRQIDMVARYGGEEFCVILTETDKEGGRLAAERIRQAIESKVIKVYDEALKVTISAGVATFPADADMTDGLIEKSDSALYQAKQKGRNRVCVI